MAIWNGIVKGVEWLEKDTEFPLFVDEFGNATVSNFGAIAIGVILVLVTLACVIPSWRKKFF